jgi:hypothetical protein
MCMCVIGQQKYEAARRLTTSHLSNFEGRAGSI